MPTYTYRREDGTIFDIKQSFHEDPLEFDPKTGQKVQRVISSTAGIIFKGSGFYVTDNAGSSRVSSNNSNSASSADSSSSNSAGSSAAD